MDEIFRAIVAEAQLSAKERQMFKLPPLKDVEIEETENPVNGSTLLSRSYKIKRGNRIINISYESKDKCRVMQINPDRSVLDITYYDNETLVDKYSDAWDEA